MKKTQSLEKKAELIWEIRTKLFNVTSEKLPKNYIGQRVVLTDMFNDSRHDTNSGFNYETGLIFDIEKYSICLLHFYDRGMKNYDDLISGKVTSVGVKDDIVRLEFVLTKMHYLIYDVIRTLNETPPFGRRYYEINLLNGLEKKVDELLGIN